MKFLDIYKSNLQSVKSNLKSLWCSEANTPKQRSYSAQLSRLIDTDIFASEEYEPLVQSMEPYESSTEDESKNIFVKINRSLWEKSTNGKNYPPYKHQIKAWESLIAEDCRSMVVTTGTGSGKTECFMIPLVNELLKIKNSDHTVKAIFLYPLNALMEDQKSRLQKLLEVGDNRKLTFAVYNGNLPDNVDDDNEEQIKREKKLYPNIVSTRNELHRDGADIILTNPTMLEYMLIRDKDRHIFEDGSLEWIVVDEAHTFTGAAATELAMLLRRVLNAFGTDKNKLHFAASSATIGNDDDKAQQEAKLKKFISDISGVDDSKIDIIPGERKKYDPETDDDKDSDFKNCKKLLTDTTCDYIKLSELLPKYTTTEKRLEKLDEYCEQGLRAKVHFFYRVANSGIRVQLDKWEDESKGVLKLQSQCPVDSITPALEVVRCKHCGEYIAIGEYQEKDPSLYNASSDSDDDLFDLNASKQHKLFFGVVRTDQAIKAGNSYVEITKNRYRNGINPTGNWAIVANTERLCPHCSASLYPDKNKKQNTTAQDVFEDDNKFKATRLRISSEYISRLMAPGLLDNMMTVEGKKIPHKGQQYISFVDSRQSAARGTFSQNVEVERDWVYSRIFHELLKRNKALEIIKQKQDLDNQLEKAINDEDTKKIGELTLKKKEIERKCCDVPDHDYLQWSEIFNLLKDEPICDYLCRQFANQTNGETEDGKIQHAIQDRYIFAVMLSNLAKYPPFQATAETMGLFKSYYPKLNDITVLPDEVVTFNKLFKTNITLEEWRNLLQIYIDRVPRSNESIYMKLDSYLHCDIFNCSERFGLQRPPHRTARKPFVNDKCNNISLIPLLLAKVIAPQSNDLIEVVKSYRDAINKVVDAMWTDLIDCQLLQFSEKIKKSKKNELQISAISKKDWEFDTDSDDDAQNIPKEQQNANGFQLRLNVADIAFKLPDKAFYCEIRERGSETKHMRPSYTTFCGFSPYPISNSILKPDYEEDWSEKYPYIYGKEADKSKTTISTINTWLKQKRSKMYDCGLLGEDGCFNTRFLNILSYPAPFIQAEHTAQVEKGLSRRTQERFKDHDINILACSTTMEMGVDLGDLELVLMSSIPPHPANYKQRAGRSGRNESTRSACITLCSSDAVGYRVLKNPMETIIKRKVEMPFVDWDSPSIIQRHVNAFLYRKSGIFFSYGTKSSLNWSLIDIFSSYHFHDETVNKNGRDYHYDNIWDLRDKEEKQIFPKEKEPLGDTRQTKYEDFLLWLENKVEISDIEFLLKDTSFSGSANDFVDRCCEGWKQRYVEIERELSYYGKQYESAYERTKNDSKNSDKAKGNGELDTSNGRRLLIKFNSILNKRLIDYLATHRFTPNADMPVEVVEFDIYHNNKNLKEEKRFLAILHIHCNRLFPNMRQATWWLKKTV